MTKFPLTPTGVDQKVNELNALTRSKLIEQANAVKNDFKEWFKINFDLTAAELSFTNGIAPAAATDIGRMTSEALLSNTTIVYEPAPAPPSYSGKNVDVAKKEKLKIDAVGNYTYESTLVFTVSYY